MTLSHTINIDGTSYEVQSLRPGQDHLTLTRTLRTGDGLMVYHIDRDTDGRLKCSCPDFVLRASAEGRPCKHIHAATTLGLLTI